jgi:hypothetical protein
MYNLHVRTVVMLLIFGQEIIKYACSVAHVGMMIRICMNTLQLVQTLFGGG